MRSGSTGVGFAWFLLGALVGAVVAVSLKGDADRPPNPEWWSEFESSNRGSTSPNVNDAELSAAELIAERDELARRLRDLETERARLERLLAEAQANAATPPELESLSAALEWLRRLDPAAFGDLSAEELRWTRSLDLTGMEVVEADLAQLRRLPALREISLRDAPLTDAGLELVCRAPRLARLDIGATRVSDLGAMYFIGLTSLRSLDLEALPISNVGVASLAGLPELRSLSLSGTRVDDSGLRHLRDLFSLRDLDLRGLKVTSAGLEALEDLRALRRLDLRGTSVDAAGIAAFRERHPECEVVE